MKNWKFIRNWERGLGISVGMAIIALLGFGQTLPAVAQSNKTRLKHNASGQVSKTETASAQVSSVGVLDSEDIKLIKEYAELQNSVLPMPAGELGTMTKSVYIPARRVLQMQYIMNSNVPYSLVAGNAVDPAVKANLVNSMCSNQYMEGVLMAMTRAGVSYEYIYTFEAEPGKKVVMTITPEEINHILHGSTTSDKKRDALSIIDREVKATALPMDCGNGIVCVSLGVEDDAYKTVYEVDESLQSIGNIENAREAIAENTLKSFMSPTLIYYACAIRDAGLDMVNVYRGASSKKTATVVITNKRLADAIDNFMKGMQ